MKKVLSLVALLGALAGTASAAPYYMPTPAGGALTPYDWQPVYSIDGVYSISDRDSAPDTCGARLGFSLYSSGIGSVRHQFTILAGYEEGTEHSSFDIGEEIAKYDVDLYRIPLTLGYDINLGLTDNVFIDLGVKAGYAWGTVESKVKEAGAYTGYSTREHLGGFTFGLGAGVKVQCSDAIYVKLGYEFNRTYFGKVGGGDFEGISRSMNYGSHSIVLSVGCLF